MAQAATTLMLIPARREPLRSPLDIVVQNAGDKLKALHLTCIAGGEASNDEARALIRDLQAIAEIVDPVIAAIGDYAESHLGSLDQSLFQNQLLGALDGNATYEIETKIERRDDARRDDLYDKRRLCRDVSEARMNDTHTPTMVPVESSNVDAIGYHGPTHEMHVRFKKGGYYVYAGVPTDIFHALMSAPSKGAFLSAHIKGKYDTRRLP